MEFENCSFSVRYVTAAWLVEEMAVVDVWMSSVEVKVKGRREKIIRRN